MAERRKIAGARLAEAIITYLAPADLCVLPRLRWSLNNENVSRTRP